MAGNNRIRENSERKGVVTGVVMTAVLHLCALALVSFTGLKYIYPPPQERAMLIDFTDEPAALVEEQYGTEPQAEEVNLDEAVRLVQQSSSPEVADRENLTPETAPDDFGDVETPAPEPEQPALDPRAAFPGMARKDTTLTAAHAAADSSALFKAGQAAGNTASGRTDGKPNAHVQGRGKRYSGSEHSGGQLRQRGQGRAGRRRHHRIGQDSLCSREECGDGHSLQHERRRTGDAGGNDNILF